MPSCCAPLGSLSSGALECAEKIHEKVENQCSSIQLLHLKDWKGRDWPHYFDGHVFMFHAPVGNSWILEQGHKVKVFISGFCASPEAGFKYVDDVLKNESHYHNERLLAHHAFDTDTMRSGINKIGIDINLHTFLGLKDLFSKMDSRKSALLFTQALCPISTGASWEAKDIWDALFKSSSLRKLASGCVSKWFKCLKEHCDDNTKIVLLGLTEEINCDGSIKNRRKLLNNSSAGGELIKLLLCSRLEKDEDGKVTVTNSDQENTSLLAWLNRTFKNNIYVTYHPSKYDIYRLRFKNRPDFRKLTD
jgi:hypothetical protein